MGDDHAADGIGVDKSSIESEGDEMLTKDHWLQIEIEWDEGPCSSKSKEAKEGDASALTAGTACLHNIQRTANVRKRSIPRQRDLPHDSVEDQHDTAIDHVPLVPSEVINRIRDEVEFTDSKTSKHRLLPEAATTQVCRERIDDTKCENALNGTGNHTECKRMCMVLVPSLNVKGQ
jgi:hypothetical protein